MKNLGPHGAVFFFNYSDTILIKVLVYKTHNLILLFYYSTSLFARASFSARIISSKLYRGCGRRYTETQWFPGLLGSGAFYRHLLQIRQWGDLYAF